MNYLLIFFISFLFCLMVTLLLKNIGNKYNFFDIAPEDDPLKIHKTSISYLGGLGMMLTLLFGFLIVLLEKKYFITEITAIALGSVCIFSLGFWDDAKWKNIPDPKPYRKFICLIIFPLIASYILSLAGVRINFFNFLIADYLLTFLYIFVLVNSINYEDGIDGLAGGLVLISLAGFFILSLFFKNELALLFSLILSGAVVGFLVFNFPRAKIFMGDSGAFFLGFALSVCAAFFLKPYNIVSFLGLIFISGFPIFEGVFTNIRRIINKKSIFFGDRQHFYDTLYIAKGFSIQKTLLICYAIQAILVIIGLLLFFYANTLVKT